MARIYVMKAGRIYKIGMSSNVESRLKQLNILPVPISLVYQSKPFDNAPVVEQFLHSVYEKQHIRGEWFRLSDRDIDNIIEFLNDGRAETL